MPGSTEYTKDTMLKQDILNPRRQAEARARAENLADGEVKEREEGRIEDREEGLAEGEANCREEGRIEDREEGLAEGEANGREEGRIEDRAEGLVEGEARGLEKGKIAVTLNLKAMGLPMADITKPTGLTAEELQQLTAK